MFVFSIFLIVYSAKVVVTIPVAGDRFVFPRDEDVFDSTTILPMLTSAPKPTKSDFIRCLDLGDQMPTFNRTTFKFECFPLATKGPYEGESKRLSFNGKIFLVDRCYLSCFSDEYKHVGTLLELW